MRILEKQEADGIGLKVDRQKLHNRGLLQKCKVVLGDALGTQEKKTTIGISRALGQCVSY